MKAQQLIIGAYLMSADGARWQAMGITESTLRCRLVAQPIGIVTFGIDELLPVPITPEILAACGFTFDVYRWLFRVGKRGYQVGKLAGGGYGFGKQGENARLTHLTGLHHLQMLLYAMSGIELTLTPTPALQP